LGVIVVAAAFAFVAKAVRRPIHPTVRVGDLGDRPGVVLFTSTDCSNCKRAIARLKDLAIPFREVTHELEPRQLEAWEVVAVPLTVVLDADGEAVAVLSGVPARRAIVKAVRSVGMDA
jgi:hypothetical protein